MQKLIYILLIGLIIFNCNSTKPITSKTDEQLESLKQNDTVSIANDELEYQIIIIEPGFNFWLASTAKPEGYYSQSFLENRNYQYVIEWNQRVIQPQIYNPNLYELRIDYQPGIDYGYEVNYKLYNYFIYFQLKYKQRLGPYTPRI
ncbi:hypothetical protein SAMN05428642_1021034 [Flaviramulus basaltis]|uniref:Uncharacterized protein n=1 Tax=Flaviramulus basaltis TaxID=369401 RepID=A0A1K2IK69_9FLAO|nr:DUF6146 family protein [Flaviramulus basaltis]SFZ92845.1 hypothetical protein SAMN05428642_1021034 [Flaviramulus basaltis]